MAFKDDIVVDVKQEKHRYNITIEHLKTRLSVSATEVKQCHLFSTQKAMIIELRQNVERQIGRTLE